jgi:methionyl-tRNA formyltransferase
VPVLILAGTLFYAKIDPMKIPIVFMGSPDFAVPSLQALAEHFAVVGVVTQPDRPAGRGHIITPPPVKSLAIELGIPIIQPQRLRIDVEAKEQLRSWNPEIIVVTAFGQILKRDVLELARFGCINAHASLLPRWRGVSPIQSAILNGDNETGVTIMKMNEGIDTGDILTQKSIPIEAEDTGGSLFEKLSKLAADLLVETLPKYLQGDVNPRPQGDSPTPYAPILIKSDGVLDFNKPALVLARQVRAYHPWPGTYTLWKGKPLKIQKTQVLDIASPGIGVFTIQNGNPAIGTAQGLLVIEELQPAGKKTMPGKAFLLGEREWGTTI